MINRKETIQGLCRLKLEGMANRYNAILSLPVNEMPTLDEGIAMLVDAEESTREQKQAERLMKKSHIRYNASVEGFETGPERNITKDMLLRLADCSFVRSKQNILIQGPTGCGKSYLASALGRQACRMGLKAEYYPMGHFIEDATLAKTEGTFGKMLKRLSRNDLVIFDDWGLQPLSNYARLAFLEVLEEFYDRKSIIVTAQLPINQWYEYIKEPTLADAIMDRLMANSHRVELKGKSRRARL